MLYWRFHFEKEILINCLFIQWKWTYILDFEPWRWSALNMGYMEKRLSILVKDNRHGGKIWVLKDNRSEGQQHGVEEILLKGNCYSVEVAVPNYFTSKSWLKITVKASFSKVDHTSHFWHHPSPSPASVKSGGSNIYFST